MFEVHKGKLLNFGIRGVMDAVYGAGCAGILVGGYGTLTKEFSKIDKRNYESGLPDFYQNGPTELTANQELLLELDKKADDEIDFDNKLMFAWTLAVPAAAIEATKGWTAFEKFVIGY